MNLFGQGITSFSFIGIIANAKAKDISFGGVVCFFILFLLFYSDYFQKSRFLVIYLFVVN